MSTTTTPDDTTSQLSPATEAYIWGYPLVAVQRTRLLFCSRSDTGRMNHVENLATPADRGVVVPNNDTLYSSGWYDLRYGDLIIEVPPMDHPKRYWNLMIVDAYTHVTYVCRRHHGVAGTKVRVTFDPSRPPPNDASEVMPVATPTAWVIARVLVESPDDLEQARTVQRAITVTAPTNHPHERTTRVGRATAIPAAKADFYQELARYTQFDAPAPWHPPLTAAARAILENPAAFDPEELDTGVEIGDKLIRGRNTQGNVEENGWSTGREATDFGSDPLKRATGAMFGLGGHQAIENRSYVARNDTQGKPLNGAQALTLRFAAATLPPCDAFWSLTAYGPDLYLVANEIERYSIGDRTPGLHYERDGSLTLTLSALRPKRIANWLPVPDGPYLLGMRVYEGHDTVVNCGWFPPALVPTAV